MNKHSTSIWSNGKLIPWDEARAHIMCHVLHYGTGVFEGIRAYATDRGPAVFRLRDHVARLFESAKIYSIDIPFTQDQILQACVDVVSASGLTQAYVRPLAFWGYGQFGLHATGLPTEVHIACWEWEQYLGAGGKEKGIRAVVSSWRKFAPDAIPPAAKACGQYLSSILSGNDARRRGYDEAILLDHRGLVAEGCGENVFLVKDGTLITNDLSSSILPGITRATVLEIARDLGIPSLVKDIAPSEMVTADEMFFTGTAAEVTPVREINDRTIGGGKRGPVTERLQSEYMKAVSGQTEKYRRWLTWPPAATEKKTAGRKHAAAAGG
ncbi:MAG: branched-chain amino acid transaminase [Planctomycetes bacterium]|nr:branched-chain amino acid transaminase [Planctomycetota bacterium]